ncbi:Probable RNA-directed DNA polymerase from transposon BS [Anthophora plagiata]
MVLLDIQKAFDKVWIDGLLHKMIKQEYPKYLIKLIHSYITERTFKVVYNSSKSTTRKTRAGVPQGSVLGPQLFKIYLNDIPEFQKTKMALFADDTALYAHSFNAIVAAKQIQIHIYELQKYYDKWKIQINPDKTKVIVFSKKRKESKIFTPITLYNKKTTTLNSVKYLGVHLDSKLTYRIHIKQSIKKVYAVMKKIYPLMVKNSAVQIKNKKLLYTTILRPIIMYAVPVWCSTAPTNIKPLQVFQNKCLRLMLSRDRYEKIKTLHEDARVPLISDYIRETAQKFYTTKIKNINKLLNGIGDIRINNSVLKIKHKLPYQRLPIYQSPI